MATLTTPGPRSFSPSDPLAAWRELSDHRRVDASPADDRDALLRDPELRRAIERVVSGRVRESEVEDVLQETLLAVSRAAFLPEDPADRRQYILGIARNKAGEHRRTNRRQVDVQDGVDTEHVAVPAVAAQSVVDVQLLSKIVATLPEDQIPTFRCYARRALGESLAEIAREIGVDYDVLYKRVTTLEKRLRLTGRTLVGALALMLLVSAVWWVLQPKPEIAPRPQLTEPTEAPATSTKKQDTSRLDEARSRRAKAFAECTRFEWKDCLADLDAARTLDPAGEDATAVSEAREDAERGVESMTGFSQKTHRAYMDAKP